MFFLKDDPVSLRLFNESDIERKVSWINDPENNQHLHYDIPLEISKTQMWFKNKDNTKRLDLVIEYDGLPVGLIGLLQIDNGNKKAEFYISMGETSFKRKGIATKASELLIRYAFSEIDLHKVYLNTDGENHAAHRLFEKVGFKREGVFKDDMIHHGKYIDRIRYAIINKAEVSE